MGHKRICELEQEVAELKKFIQPDRIVLTSKENPNVSFEISVVGEELLTTKRVKSEVSTVVSIVALDNSETNKKKR